VIKTSDSAIDSAKYDENLKAARKKLDKLRARYGSTTIRVGAANRDVNPLIDSINANSEWEFLVWQMKDCMECAKQDSVPSTADFWCRSLQNGAVKHRMPEVAKLAEIMLLAPTGSVENERSFSDMNFIKDDRRNSLGEKHLNACMKGWRCRFTLENFPYEVALAIWMASASRKLGAS